MQREITAVIVSGRLDLVIYYLEINYCYYVNQIKSKLRSNSIGGVSGLVR